MDGTSEYPPVDPQILNLTRAIALTESSNGGKPDYNAKGQSGEAGAYQWMPGNFADAAKQYGLDPTDMSAENQDKVAYAQVYSMVKNKGYAPYQVASAWNSGSPDNWQNHSGVNSMGVSYNTPDYVKRVQMNFLKLNGQGSNPQPAPNTSGSDNSQSPITFSESDPTGSADAGGNYNSDNGPSQTTTPQADPQDPSTWGLSPLKSDWMTITGGNSMVTPTQYAIQEGQKTGALFASNAMTSDVGSDALDILKVIPNLLSSTIKAGGGVISSIMHPIQTVENIASDPLSLVPDAYKQIAGGVFNVGGDLIKGNQQQAVSDGLAALDKARISFEDDPVGTYLLGKGLTEGVGAAAEGTAGLIRDPLGNEVDAAGKATTPVGKVKQGAQSIGNAIANPGDALMSGFKKTSALFKKAGAPQMMSAIQDHVNSILSKQKSTADMQDLLDSLGTGLSKARDGVESEMEIQRNKLEEDKQNLDGAANMATELVKRSVTPQSFADAPSVLSTIKNFFSASKDFTDKSYSAALRNADGSGTTLTFNAKGDVIDAINNAAETMDKESAGSPAVADVMTRMVAEARDLSEKNKIDANNVQEFVKRWNSELRNKAPGLSKPTLDAFDGIRQAAYKAQEDTMSKVGKSSLIGDLQKTRSVYSNVILSKTTSLLTKFKSDPEGFIKAITKPDAWGDFQKTMNAVPDGGLIIAHLQNFLTRDILDKSKDEMGNYDPKKIDAGVKQYKSALNPDHASMLKENASMLRLSSSIGKVGSSVKDIVSYLGKVKSDKDLETLTTNATTITGRTVLPTEIGSAYLANTIDDIENNAKYTTGSARLEALFSAIDKVGGKGRSDLQDAVFGKDTMDLLNSMRDPKTGALAAFKEVEGFKKTRMSERVSNGIAAGLFAVLKHGLIAAGFGLRALKPEEDLPIAKTFLPKGAGGAGAIIKGAKGAVSKAATAGEASQNTQPVESPEQLQQQQQDQSPETFTSNQ